MTRLAHWLISVAVSTVALFGQSLMIPPSSTSLKTSGVFTVNIDSPPGKAPVAMQWEFWVPPVIAMSPMDVRIGTAAESSGKSLTCAIREHDPPRGRGRRCACILEGGTAPIANGPIATVQYRVQWAVNGGPIHVAVERVLGVSADVKPIPIANAQGVIDIQ